MRHTLTHITEHAFSHTQHGPNAILLTNVIRASAEALLSAQHTLRRALILVLLHQIAKVLQIKNYIRETG